MLTENEAPAPNEPRQLCHLPDQPHRAAQQRHLRLRLDDLHLITERTIHEILDYLLDHAPANLRVVLADPSRPAHVARQAPRRGEVTEIRLDDLSFAAEGNRRAHHPMPRSETFDRRNQAAPQPH